MKAMELWPSPIRSLPLGSARVLPPKGCSMVSSCCTSKVAIGWAAAPASASSTSMRSRETGDVVCGHPPAARCSDVREGLRLVVFGGAVGLAAAFALSRLLKSLLYGVGPHDPLSFVAVTLLLALVALAATLIPARAAMKVEPVEALRYE